MARYTIEGAGAVLETAAPDGTYEHPSEKGGTWNGFAVPHATYSELLAYSEAVLALGNRWTFRPEVIEGTILLLHFPCEGDCKAGQSGDFWDLGNGEHAHHDDSYEFEVTGADDPVYVDGLIWDLVDDASDVSPLPTIAQWATT